MDKSRQMAVVTDPAKIIGKKLCVWGAGIEGAALLSHLRKELGITEEIVLLDQNPDARKHDTLQGQYAPLRIKSEPASVSCDIVFRSPGVSPYSEAWQQLVQTNPAVSLSSGTALWLSHANNRKRTVGITGTKGKSSCTALLALVLEKLGHPVSVGGNSSEVPLLDMAKTAHKGDTRPLRVVEISSFQAVELGAPFKPDVVLLTNIYRAHSDWHGTHEQYVRDKLKLCADTEHSTTLCNARDANTRRYLGQSQYAEWYGDKRGFNIRAQQLYEGDTKLGKLTNPLLHAAHKHDNVCGVLGALCAVLGTSRLDWDTVVATLNAFGGVRHRQEYLGRHGGHHYVDDGTATVPEATLAALDVCRRRYGDHITLLLGGQQHTQDYTRLVGELCDMSHVRVVLLPDNGPEIAALFETHAPRNTPPLFLADDLAHGVRWARKNTDSGGTILLSPAAPSTGRFVNYLERSQLFRKLATET